MVATIGRVKAAKLVEMWIDPSRLAIDKEH
jgi:hypothetical protein